MTDVTQIVNRIEQSDPGAAELPVALVHDELRKLASAKLANEKPGQTLQAAALVHEDDLIEPCTAILHRTQADTNPKRKR